MLDIFYLTLACSYSSKYQINEWVLDFESELTPHFPEHWSCLVLIQLILHISRQASQRPRQHYFIKLSDFWVHMMSQAQCQLWYSEDSGIAAGI